MTRHDIPELLNHLAATELDSAKAWISQHEAALKVALLIEMCRVMDYHHVLHVFSRNPSNQLPLPDFDIMVRGWNPALGLLLPFARTIVGVPMMASTSASRSAAMTFLHQLGRSVLLNQTADMIRHGMADGALVRDGIVLQMSRRVTIDHFHDRLEPGRLDREADRIGIPDPYRALLEHTDVPDLDDRMSALTFPWDTGRGIMIGYDTAPEIDQHYLARVVKNTVDWRNEAGIHPGAQIGNVPGADLAIVGMLLISFGLKHIRFVDLGCKKIPTASYPMSLTIWKSDQALVQAISAFADMPREAVHNALRLLTVRQADHSYFAGEPTPFVPLLLEVSEGYLLSPISGIFRNPFQGIRMLQEGRLGNAESTVREPRESWMVQDLRHLFMGSRYIFVDTPIRLKRSGRTVTDIDAAVFDLTSGTLALFQLKWQDFSSSSVRTQRSKAKNFVERVDAWATAVEQWLQECGAATLIDVLRLHRHQRRQIVEIKLFALGRVAARFQSYGYVQETKSVAVCSWAQFVRIRFQVGPVENVLLLLHEAIRADCARTVGTIPLRHEVTVGSRRIVFEDFWQIYDDKESGS